MHSWNELALTIRIVDSCSITKLKRQNMFERGGVRLAESLAGAGDVALSKDPDKLSEFAARYGDLNRAHSGPLLLPFCGGRGRRGVLVVGCILGFLQRSGQRVAFLLGCSSTCGR